MQPNEQDECAFFALPPILLALLFKFPDESHAKLFSIWTLVQGRNTHNAQEVVCVCAYLCVCVFWTYFKVGAAHSGTISTYFLSVCSGSCV